jgi:anti-sigma regulatory factor (Ser/Thr protein kinase)
MGVIQEPVTVRLELESHPENVALVRSALTGIAEAVDLSDELIADLKTAISEACNNVALHAYDGGSGPMIVELDGSSAGITVSVIDHGRGITRISGGEDRMGLGLAVISALADSSEFRHPSGGGTEVRMWFQTSHQELALDSSGGTEWPQSRSLAPSPSLTTRTEGEILVFVAPVPVMRFVLGRMMPSIAAASHFSLTKISDLRAANEAIAGYIEEAADGGVSIAITSSSRRLSMTTGPLPARDLESAREALGSVVDGLSAEQQNIRIELMDCSRGPVA